MARVATRVATPGAVAITTASTGTDTMGTFVRGPFFGFYGGYYDYYPNYYDDCYQVRRVRTAHGWRWRRIYVCDYPYQ